MSKLCGRCGVQQDDAVRFCTNCGASFEANLNTVPYQQEETKKSLSIWTYVGLLFLFSIPCIGLIAAIVFAVAPKNESLKTFARGYLIFMVIAAILSAILFAVFAATVMVALEEAISEFQEEGYFESFPDNDFFNQIVPDDSNPFSNEIAI